VLPLSDPARLTAISVARKFEVSPCFLRYTHADAIPPGNVTALAVALALMGGTPAITRAGKTRNMPPPAKAFTTPPVSAAAIRMVQEKMDGTGKNAFNGIAS
jgi:hypothetical protein